MDSDEAGEDDFDEKRLTERFVGLVFGWDGAAVCGWVGFADYAYAGVGRSVCEREKRRRERTRYLDSSHLRTWTQTLEFPT